MNAWNGVCVKGWLCVAFCVLVCAAAPLWAGDLYWDTDSGSSGLQGGNGDWDSSSFWNDARDGSGTPQGWTSGSHANFNNGTTASSVNLEGQTWTVEKFDITRCSVTLTNGAINLSGGITNYNGNSLSGLNAPISLTATQRFDLRWSGISRIGGSLNIGDYALEINSTGNNRADISADMTGSADITISTDTAIGHYEANNARYMQFTGNNGAFTGNYILNKGVLGLYSGSGGYTANSVVQFGNTADDKEFYIWAGTITLGGLHSTGGAGAEYVSLGYHSDRTLTLDTSVTGGDFDFSGSIRELDATKLLSLVKTGAGTQILSGTNTYTGTTAVDGGSLLVNGMHTNGGAYTVSSGATLGGSGTIMVPITLHAGSTLAPGGTNGLGTLTVSNLTCGVSNTIRMVVAGEAPGQYGSIRVTDGCSLATEPVLDLDDAAFAGGDGTEVVILAIDGTEPCEGAFQDYPEGALVPGTPGDWTISYAGGDGNDVTLRMAPLQIDNRPAANVTATEADLVGEIIYAGTGPVDFRVYYGTNDGLNVAGDWETNTLFGTGLTAGVYTSHVANLQTDTLYFYRVMGESAATSVWALTSATFGTRFVDGMAPSNLTAQGGWDQVDLAWQESFNTEIGMVIERGTNAAFAGDVTRWFVAGNSTTGTVDVTPITGLTSHYRVAATNSAGLSAWSDAASTVATASVVTVAQVTLTASSVFDLQEATQKMALRGTRAATISAWIAGIEVDLAETNAFYDYGAPTNSSWYIDPYDKSYYTKFRESYEWPFDFGNGVVTNLNLVPVYINQGTGWRNNLLLNLGYTGEITIDGTDYIVDVVQGASPEFKDRLSYPGYFNDPAVCILLYEAATTNRVPGLTRLRQINGTWYCFDNNASGEQLTVRRMDGTGTLELDAGPFQSNDLSFASGVITHEQGWSLSLPDLVYSNAATVLPAGKYTFSECTVSNAAKTFRFIYHSSIQDATGSVDIPPDGVDVLTIGQNYEIRVVLKNYKNPNRFHDYLWMDCQLIDTDMGAAVVPEEAEWLDVVECRNSTGGVIECQWSSPHLCGWNGAYLFTDETRIGADGSPFGLPTDYHPPAVYDTRTLRIGSTITGLYGEVYTNTPYNVRNEQKVFRARYCDFDEALSAFPDFDSLLPDLEVMETNTPPSVAVTDPWAGLPAEMADTFGACYDFEFYQNSSSLYKGPATYSMYIKCQGSARVYWDGELIVENISHDAVTEVGEFLPSTVDLGTYHDVRIEYFHNEGPSMLQVRLSGTIPLSSGDYSVAHTLQPTYQYCIAPAQVPVSIGAPSPSSGTWTAPAAMTVQASPSHPDGVGGVEVYIDGLRQGTDTNAPYACAVTNLPVNAEVSVRAEDIFGYGVSSNLDLSIERETLQAWLQRHGLSDPDDDGDDDGMINREEYGADTNPTNGASAFVVTGIEACGTSNCVSWTGTQSPLTLDHYEVQVSHDLTAASPPGGWASVVSKLPLDLSGSNSCWHVMEGASNAYYRVRGVQR